MFPNRYPLALLALAIVVIPQIIFGLDAPGVECRDVETTEPTTQEKTSAKTPAKIPTTTPTKGSGKVCNIMDYGATEGTRDQGQDVGPAILKAWEDCVLEGSGPSTVLIPAGKSFRMMSRVLLDKGKNTVFQWDGDVHLALMYTIKGFNLNGAMFQFMHCDNIKLLGKGTFFGSGILYRKDTKEGDNVPMEKRPRMVMFYKASNVEVAGLTLNDSPSYHLNAVGDNIHVHDITVLQPQPVKGMTDGISLTCDHCLVERCSVTNGDDCVVLKSPSNHVVVRNIDCHKGGGVGLGTVGHNGVWQMSNISFDQIIMTGTIGASIKSFPDATGTVSDVTFSNIRHQDVNYPIFMQQYFLKDTSHPKPMTWQNIKFLNFTGNSTELIKPPILINCSPASSCVNIIIANFQVKQAGTRNTPISVRNACGNGPGLTACSGGSKETRAAPMHRRTLLPSH